MRIQTHGHGDRNSWQWHVSLDAKNDVVHAPWIDWWQRVGSQCGRAVCLALCDSRIDSTQCHIQTRGNHHTCLSVRPSVSVFTVTSPRLPARTALRVIAHILYTVKDIRISVDILWREFPYFNVTGSVYVCVRKSME